MIEKLVCVESMKICRSNNEKFSQTRRRLVHGRRLKIFVRFIHFCRVNHPVSHERKKKHRYNNQANNAENVKHFCTTHRFENIEKRTKITAASTLRKLSRTRIPIVIAYESDVAVCSFGYEFSIVKDSRWTEFRRGNHFYS